MLLFLELCHLTACEKRKFSFHVRPSYNYSYSYPCNVIIGRLVIGGKTAGQEVNRTLEEDGGKTQHFLALLRGSC